MNTWTFSGEIVKVTEITNSNKFRAAITIKGLVSGKDIDNPFVEFSCMIPVKLWNRKIKLYKNIEVTGHFENWVRYTSGGNYKNTLSRIADAITM